MPADPLLSLREASEAVLAVLRDLSPDVFRSCYGIDLDAPDAPLDEAIAAYLRAVRETPNPVAPTPAPSNVGAGKLEQAPDWGVKYGKVTRRYFAYIGEGGWSAWAPDASGRYSLIALGPETGALGQCLADLVLCSRGHLAWERIAWASPKHQYAAFMACPDDGSDLFPFIDAVLAAVREVTRA